MGLGICTSQIETLRECHLLEGLGNSASGHLLDRCYLLKLGGALAVGVGFAGSTAGSQLPDNSLC